MNFTLLILDGVLVLIFIVGWAEASINDGYRLTFARFVRALSLPFLIGLFLHFITVLQWWPPLPFSIAALNLHWLVKIIVAAISFLLMMAFVGMLLPLAVLRLTASVISQFAPGSTTAKDEVQS